VHSFFYLNWIYHGKETSGAMESPVRTADGKGEATESSSRTKDEKEGDGKTGQGDG